MKRFACITVALAIFAAAPVLAQSNEKAAKKGCSSTCKKTCADGEKKAACAEKAKTVSCCGTCDGKTKAKAAASSCSKTCSQTCDKTAKAAAASCCGTCGGKAKTAAASCSQTCDKSGKATCAKSGCGKGAAVASCSKSGCDKTGSGKNCVGETVAVKGVMIPRMGYKVGDECVKCPKSAAEMAKKNNAKMEYVVGDKTYTDKGEAVEAHAKVIDAFMDEMLTVRYAVGDKCVGCPNAAKAMAKNGKDKVQYRVASFSFDNREAAEKAIKKARAKATAVKMQWQVGDKKFCCPTSAKTVAKTEGKTVEMCVGDKATKCDKMANYELAMARLNAALESLANAGGVQVAAG